ncbi:hypothetical protein LEMLEM_LOCUS2050, partial [Lemmus lemmus]
GWIYWQFPSRLFTWNLLTQILSCLPTEPSAHSSEKCPQGLAVSFMKQEPQRIVSPLVKFSSHFSAGPACPVHQAVQAYVHLSKTVTHLEKQVMA